MKFHPIHLAVPGLATASNAFAHVGGGLATGAVNGFLHPLLGLDHLLAMLALGLWAAQIGGRALWALPLSFLATMAVGGALGMAGAALPAVELGIGASVLVFGLLLLTSSKLPMALGVGLTSLFALFHGHAHGTEMAAGASALLYGFGFVVAAMLLHGLGIGAARVLEQRAGAPVLRAAGTAIAAAGSVLLAGAV